MSFLEIKASYGDVVEILNQIDLKGRIAIHTNMYKYKITIFHKNRGVKIKVFIINNISIFIYIQNDIHF